MWLDTKMICQNTPIKFQQEQIWHIEFSCNTPTLGKKSYLQQPLLLFLHTIDFCTFPFLILHSLMEEQN